MIFKVLDSYIKHYPCDTAIYIGLDVNDNIIMQFNDETNTRIVFNKDDFYRVFDI